MIRQYNSPAELVADAQKLDAMRGINNSADDRWVGETQAQTIQRAKFGDRSLVGEAQKLIDQLDTQIETPRRVWERAPVGVYCAVPDVLAGLPTPMRRLRESNDDRAPIAIMVVSTSSAGIKAATLQKRGTAILALTMALARVRPISLWSVSMLDGDSGDRVETVLLTRIETAPLDLATACYVLTSAGWDRRLCHGISWRINGYTGGWPRDYYNKKDAYCQSLVERFSPTTPDKTLFIRESYLTDQLVTQPILWLNAQIHKFTAETQDATS